MSTLLLRGGYLPSPAPASSADAPCPSGLYRADRTGPLFGGWIVLVAVVAAAPAVGLLAPECGL
jgi:hypothetical protein